MPSTHKFPLSKSGKEFPVRFGGQEVTYTYPSTYAEVRAAAERTLADHKPAEGEKAPTVDELLYNLAMHQSGHLNIQKRIKAVLDSDAVEGMSIADAIALAVTEGEKDVVTIPGTRRGEGKVAKVAKLTAEKEKVEKEKDAALAQLEVAYLSMPKAARAAFAKNLLDQGIFTAERLKELDAQK